jgi:poly-gamma-glutamate capsule biosynthesis protein CapA/YwtB (metallophosphatase superfamily)
MHMRNAFKAFGAILAVLALCAPLMFWPTDEGQTTPTLLSQATVTLPAIAVVPTTLPPDETSTTTTSTLPSTQPSTTTTTAEPTEDITVAAVGDVLPHMAIVNSVRDPITGGYQFYPVFAPVAPYLRAADYTVANLETTFGGPGIPYSASTSSFNSPDSLAGALRDAGINLVSTANNHALDQGWDGLVRTLDVLDASGLSHVGTYRSPEERATPFIVNIKGIEVAFLDYTDSLNGLDLTDEHAAYAVNTLDVDKVAADAALARMWGADVVIALLHYGDEYERIPNERQISVSKDILSHGVDVILGSHTHVVQRIDHVFEYTWTVNDKYVAYSLGNFVSAQREQYRDSGLIAYVHISKTGQRTRVTGIEYLPVYVQLASEPSGDAYRVLPVSPGRDPVTDTTLTELDRQRMASVWDELRSVLYRPDEDIQNLDPFEFGL